MTEEIWKDIEEFPGYQVSNLGRIKSFKKGKERIITGKFNGSYYQVGLFKNGERVRRYVSRLVAITFIPNPDFKPHVNHIDGNKLNNVLSNLEWVGRSQNIRHALYTDLMKVEKVVAKVEPNTKAVIAIYRSASQAGKENDVHSSLICNAINRNHKCYGFEWKYLNVKLDDL